MRARILFVLISCVAFVPQMLYAMQQIPSTPDERRDRWVQLQQEIMRLERELSAVQRAFDALEGKEIPEVDPSDMKNDIEQYKAAARVILDRAARQKDEWVQNKEALLYGLLTRITQGIKGLAGTSPSAASSTTARTRAQDYHISPIPGGADMPSAPPLLTSQQKKYAIGAAIAAALGVLYQKVPEWTKNRVKRILAEHGKTLADVTPAEQDLLIAASYARFIPGGSFAFQDAVLDMPIGETISEELWPVLYHVYYGKKRVTRKQRNVLRELYDEAQEVAFEWNEIAQSVPRI